MPRHVCLNPPTRAGGFVDITASDMRMCPDKNDAVSLEMGILAKGKAKRIDRVELEAHAYVPMNASDDNTKTK